MYTLRQFSYEQAGVSGAPDKERWEALVQLDLCGRFEEAISLVASMAESVIAKHFLLGHFLCRNEQIASAVVRLHKVEEFAGRSEVHIACYYTQSYALWRLGKERETSLEKAVAVGRVGYQWCLQWQNAVFDLASLLCEKGRYRESELLFSELDESSVGNSVSRAKAIMGLIASRARSVNVKTNRENDRFFLDCYGRLISGEGLAGFRVDGLYARALFNMAREDYRSALCDLNTALEMPELFHGNTLSSFTVYRLLKLRADAYRLLGQDAHATLDESKAGHLRKALLAEL